MGNRNGSRKRFEEERLTDNFSMKHIEKTLRLAVRRKEHEDYKPAVASLPGGGQGWGWHLQTRRNAVRTAVESVLTKNI